MRVLDGHHEGRGKDAQRMRHGLVRAKRNDAPPLPTMLQGFRHGGSLAQEDGAEAVALRVVPARGSAALVRQRLDVERAHAERCALGEELAAERGVVHADHGAAAREAAAGHARDAGRECGGRLRGARGRGARERRAQRQHRRRAAAVAAGDVEGGAHELGKARADGEAEAEAAVATRARLARLREAREDVLAVLGGDAGPRVRHLHRRHPSAMFRGPLRRSFSAPVFNTLRWEA